MPFAHAFVLQGVHGVEVFNLGFAMARKGAHQNMAKISLEGCTLHVISLKLPLNS